jgi:hypothetical protein
VQDAPHLLPDESQLPIYFENWMQRIQAGFHAAHGNQVK